MAQWVKNPAAVAWVTVETGVGSLPQHSALKTQCCHSYHVGRHCGSDSVPGLGTSICHEAAIKIIKLKGFSNRSFFLTSCGLSRLKTKQKKKISYLLPV